MRLPALGVFAAGFLLVLCGAAIAYLVVDAEEGPVHRGLAAYAGLLDRRARFLWLAHGGDTIARAQLAVAFCFLLVGVVTTSVTPLAPTLLVALAPPIVLAELCARRVRRLEEQLDAWLVLLASSLKASPSVADAIESTRSLIPSPFAQEIELVIKEMRLGASLRSAVSTMAARIESPVVANALSTILVASQTGGNLSETLEKTAEVLRETRRLEGVLRTKTAEGRGQVLLLASTPFVLFFVIGWIDPNWFDPVLSHLYGRALLVLCSVFWVAATFWAHRIVTVDV